jgi:hypothetical protein
MKKNEEIWWQRVGWGFGLSEMQGTSAFIAYIFCHVRIGLDTRTYEPTSSVHDNDNLGLGDIGEVHGGSVSLDERIAEELHWEDLMILSTKIFD